MLYWFSSLEELAFASRLPFSPSGWEPESVRRKAEHARELRDLRRERKANAVDGAERRFLRRLGWFGLAGE